jgi:7-dehydrocholesterol reductase
MLLWYLNVHLGGSFAALGEMFLREGVFGTLAIVWGPRLLGSPPAWAMIAIFAALELALLRVLPGKRVYGTVTPAGEVPDYPDNGLAAFVVTLALWVLATHGLGLFPASILYDRFGELLGALNVLALVMCLGLYAKGRLWPSSRDASITGNPIFDYYWGTELHPRILGWDVKQFTNCRFGMMGWPLLLLSFAAKQAEGHGLSDSMVVAVGLQLVYIAKFFVWESGYLRSMDIQHDRAGFYICWGCFVWLPCVYTSHTLYLVGHANHLGLPLAVAIFAVGVGAIAVNYLADRQRQIVRATDGKCTVWGRKPVLIHAEYVTEQGERKQSILLASGWWGLSRHFHYLPELLAAFCWSVPALFSHFAPYFYVTFLAVLLTHRSLRDDERCAAKYGAAWDEYRALVPTRIIPSFARFRR